MLGAARTLTNENAADVLTNLRLMFRLAFSRQYLRPEQYISAAVALYTPGCSCAHGLDGVVHVVYYQTRVLYESGGDAQSNRLNGLPQEDYRTMAEISAINKRGASKIEIASFVLLVACTCALSMYGIDRPLWMDEIWSYRLAQLGPAAIIDNSWTDQSPPLFYLLQYAATGFGAMSGEAAWRWPSAVAGILTVILFWRLVRGLTDRTTAIVCGFIAATSPTIVYFSQEGRPYALVLCIAAASLWPLGALLRGSERVGDWGRWILLSLVGLYLGYAYLMIVLVQGIFLLARHTTRRRLWFSISVVIAASLPLVPMAATSMGALAAGTTNAAVPTVWFTMQALLAADPNRYGFSIGHDVAPILVCSLALAGAYWCLLRRRWTLGPYLVMQIMLPLALYFGIVGPLLRLNIATTETKQFLPILVGVYPLIAGGIAFSRRVVGVLAFPAHLAALIAIMLLLYVNSIGINRLWTIAKSPEGALAMSLRDQLIPGDGVVSLHYSPDRAVGYYLRDSNVDIYVNPVQKSTKYLYRHVSSRQFFADQLTDFTSE